MARFERTKERSSDKREFRSNSSSRGDRGSFEDRPRPRSNRFSDRGPRRDSRDRRDGRDKRDVEMTKVTCSSCNSECEVPFKPTSSKPVYCSDCFSRKDRAGSNNRSSKDLDIVIEKLNKIMKALDIR